MVSQGATPPVRTGVCPRYAPPRLTRLPPYVPIPVPLPKRGWWVGVLLEKSEEEPGMAPLRLFFLSAFNA